MRLRNGGGPKKDLHVHVHDKVVYQLQHVLLVETKGPKEGKKHLFVYAQAKTVHHQNNYAQTYETTAKPFCVTELVCG